LNVWLKIVSTAFDSGSEKGEINEKVDNVAFGNK